MAESYTRSEEDLCKMLNINFEYFEFRSGFTFEEHTLFLPAVSVGNIGQLAIDLLLSNIGLKSPPPVKVGRIFHPSLEPVIGFSLEERFDPDEPSDLMTACEIFHVESLKYVIIQFHAPLTMRGRDDFVDAFMKWVEDQNFGEIIMLGSMFGADRVDYQLDVKSPFRYFASDCIGDSETDDLVKTLTGSGYKALERRQFPAIAVMEPKDRIPSENGIFHLPGSGITKLIYEKCQAKFIPFLALLVFASEGDNTPEAKLLFGILNLLYKIRFVGDDNSKLITPPTWLNFRSNEPKCSMMY